LQRGLFHFAPDWHTAATFADQRGAAMMRERNSAIVYSVFNGSISTAAAFKRRLDSLTVARLIAGYVCV
jgi:hypothetical protein